MTALRFALPDDNYKIVALAIISAVPWDWSSVHGRLERPSEKGQAASNLGLKVSSDRGVTVTVRESADWDAECLYYVVSQPPLGFILFDDAGRHLARPTLKTCKDIAGAYVIRGYRGRLTFQNDYGASVRKVQICFEEGCMWVDIISDPECGAKSDIAYLLEVCAKHALTSEPIPRSDFVG